jgi:hypothetical protein
MSRISSGCIRVLTFSLLVVLSAGLLSASSEVWIHNYLGISGTSYTGEDFSYRMNNTIFHFTDYPDSDQLTFDYSTYEVNRDFVVSFYYQKRSGDFLYHYLLDMSSGSSGTSSSRRMVNTSTGGFLYYNLYTTDGTVVRDLSSAENEDQVLYLPDGGNTFDGTFEFSVRIPSNQTLSPGEYVDTIDIELWASEDGSNWRRFDTAQLNITVRPEAIAQIAIVRPGGSFDPSQPLSLDFGSLAPGVHRQAEAVVRASSSYSIYASSTYGGQLKHEQVNEFIPYIFSFDNAVYSLSSQEQTQVLSNAQPNNAEGDRYSIDITIGEFDAWKPAGDYTDNITFRITLN